MDGPTHLRSLQALELALRTGSLKAAAERLAITPAAAGQRIKALEDYLGYALLARGRGGLRPTPELATALPHLTAAFRELASVSDLLDLQRGQELHIAAVPDFADLWLAPRLGAFRARHPNLRISINGEGDAPLRIGRIDCEITFGPRDTQRDLLFRDYVLPLSGRDIEWRVRDRPEKDRLEGFALFHVDFYKDDPAVPKWPQWVASAGHARSAPERGIRFTRIAPALDMASEGAGYALAGLALARERLESQALWLPFGIDAGKWSSHAFQVRFRTDALQRPQVRGFRRWLMDEAGATRLWLESLTAGSVAPDATA